MSALELRNAPEAIARAEAWTRRAPDDVLAWVALGRSIDASGDAREAARAYGSILELSASGAPSWRKGAQRRAVAGLLESLAVRHPPALEIAIEQYRRACVEDPDEAVAHRLYAWALAQHGDTKRALEILAEAAPRFPDDAEVFQRDAELVAGRGTRAAFLTWEASGGISADVDLVAFDAKGRPTYAAKDATWGHGPELLSHDPKPARLEVHLMGSAADEFVIGKVMLTGGEKPGARIENRPFVMMTQGSTLILP